MGARVGCVSFTWLQDFSFPFCTCAWFTKFFFVWISLIALIPPHVGLVFMSIQAPVYLFS